VKDREEWIEVKKRKKRKMDEHDKQSKEERKKEKEIAVYSLLAFLDSHSYSYLHLPGNPFELSLFQPHPLRYL